jgi:hypothetical protein
LVLSRAPAIIGNNDVEVIVMEMRKVTELPSRAACD